MLQSSYLLGNLMYIYIYRLHRKAKNICLQLFCRCTIVYINNSQISRVDWRDLGEWVDSNVRKTRRNVLMMSVKKESNIIHSCVSEPNEARPFCIRFES